MKKILVIYAGEGGEISDHLFMGHELTLQRAGCGGDPERARALIQENDGKVDAIALEGLPMSLELGAARRPHEIGATLAPVARQTLVVDGSGIRAGLERWGVILADRAQPGIFAQKRVLMVPGLNHNGLAQALGRRAADLRYADPIVYFSLPALPLVGSRGTLEQAAGPTLDQLKDAAFDSLYPLPGGPAEPRD
ncbi:MAG TPA: serine carboxypeptidase, partial [Promineifilum sp.]|nr:serine carboxypeptidase [Promineifilum sp.]